MWKKLTGLGILGVAFYVLHVVLGGILWKGYSQLMQPISDLTAAGAPNRDLLGVFTALYGILCTVFAFSAFMYLRKRVPKTAAAGALVFLAMQLVSLSYGLFPEDLAGAAPTFTGTMHIAVTFLIVPLTILGPLLIGIGLRKIEPLRKLGIYSLVTGIFIFFAGGATAIFFAQKLPYFGLVERINMEALQLWTFAFSWRLFSRGLILEEDEWAAKKAERNAI